MSLCFFVTEESHSFSQVKVSPDKNLQTRLRNLAKQALDRAEELKMKPDPGNLKPSTPDKVGVK